MNPLLTTAEYSSTLEKEGRHGGAKKTKKELQVSGAKPVLPFMTMSEYKGENPAKTIQNIGKKKKMDRLDNEHLYQNGAINRKLKMNPLLGTAEYDSGLAKEGRDGSIRKKKKSQVAVAKLANPFLNMPEYESEPSADRISKKVGNKRKLERLDTSGLSVNNELEHPKKLFRKEKLGLSKQRGDSRGLKQTENLDQKEKLGSAELKGSSQGLPKLSERKFQSRCLNTFSRNKILEKEPKKFQKYKNSERFGNKNRVNPSKQNGMKASQGLVDFSQKKKWSKQPVRHSDSFRSDAKKKRKVKTKPTLAHNAQEGPVTWGLSDLSWGNSESLSLDGIGGFNWNATPQDFAKMVSNSIGVADEESEESDNEVVVKGKKLTPAEKRAKALEEEKNMKKKEKELIEAEDNPQSPDHFERLLIGSPNSAELWIKYMGYHAVNADIEKARAVAQRAIKRIDPQLTSAKLDVWIAFLNLDFTFSPPDVFKETFMEAIRRNDDYAINSRVLNLYAEAKNVSEVDQLANMMVRKYKDKLENWLQCQNALMMVGLPDKARYLLQKALIVLNKKDHVTLISRFALLENKYGFSEQADALFENLLTSFPQRVDLLNVYVDMLVKSSRIDLARSVLERASNNQLPVRKMKTIYTKWIAFEEAHGTPSDVTRVEEAAQKYVSRVLKTSSATNYNSKNLDTREEGQSAGNEHEDAESPDKEEFGSDESDSGA